MFLLCLLHTPAGRALPSQPVPQPAVSCLQAGSCSTNFVEVWDERLSAPWPSLSCSGYQTRLQAVCDEALRSLRPRRSEDARRLCAASVWGAFGRQQAVG